MDLSWTYGGLAGPPHPIIQDLLSACLAQRIPTRCCNQQKQCKCLCNQSNHFKPNDNEGKETNQSKRTKTLFAVLSSIFVIGPLNDLFERNHSGTVSSNLNWDFPQTGVGEGPAAVGGGVGGGGGEVLCCCKLRLIRQSPAPGRVTILYFHVISRLSASKWDITSQQHIS